MKNDDEKKLWFARRQFGWGLTPVTAGGWLVVIGWLVIFEGPLIVEANLHPGHQLPMPVMLAIIWMFIGVVGLMIFAAWYLKKNYPKE